MHADMTHLDWLESESIHILREVTAEARKPVMLFSAGKDSTVMAHLALRAFYPAKPPFPLLHPGGHFNFPRSWPGQNPPGDRQDMKSFTRRV